MKIRRKNYSRGFIKNSRRTEKYSYTAQIIATAFKACPETTEGWINRKDHGLSQIPASLFSKKRCFLI
jgi:hypothetical protein